MRKKYLYLSVLVSLLLSSLLVACGDSKPDGPPPPPNLEVITAGAAPEAATTAASNATTAASKVAATSNSATTSSAAALTTTANNTTAALTTTANNTTTAPAAVAPLKKGVLLEPMTWEEQTWNNCAPMSALMALSYYGTKLTQEECSRVLRPYQAAKNEPGDKHVKPEELVAFIESKGYKTLRRENGTLDTLRALLSAGVPVITQQWLKEGEDVGHYRTARGYDMATNVIIFNDSMDKKPKTVASTELQDKLWKAYDRRYFPVYTAKQEAAVLAILGEDADAKANMNRATTAAKQYAGATPGDVDAWRNLGYLNYANGDCKAAIEVWETKLKGMLKSTEQGPTNRFLWYQTWPMECYNKLGKYEEVIKLAPNEIEKAKVFAEARYEYGVALVGVGRKDEGVASLKKALLDHPGHKPTMEMLGKLGVN